MHLQDSNKYSRFWDYYFMTQQTPKPEAQLPSLVPPASPHSVADKHVPKVKSSDADVHWALGNETTERIDNCPVKMYELFSLPNDSFTFVRILTSAFSNCRVYQRKYRHKTKQQPCNKASKNLFYLFCFY